jgi:broad specificity phosphatase PhoE
MAGLGAVQFHWMLLYLIRHGQTEWNASGKAQGHTDIPLDHIGSDQAERAAAALNNAGLTAVFTSDLSRSVATAEKICAATSATLHVEPLLRERCFGDWEGLPFDVMGKSSSVRGAYRLLEA